MNELNLQISAGSDNVSGSSEENYAYLDQLLFVTDEPDSYEIFGLRFNALNIPVGAIINSAKISLYSNYSTGSNVIATIIYGINEDDTSTFTDGEDGFIDITTRILTTNNVNWNIPVLTLNQWYDTPSIVDIIQEIIDRDGWESGNAIGFVIKSNDYTGNNEVRGFTNYNSSTVNCAKLSITYTAGGTTNKTVTPSALSLTSSLKAPTVTKVWNKTVAVATLALTLALGSPSYATNDSVTPSAQALTATLNAPTVVINDTEIPSAQSLTLSQKDPTIIFSKTKSVDKINLNISQQYPVVKNTFLQDTEQLFLTVNSPSIIVNNDSLIDSQQLTASLNTPSISIDFVGQVSSQPLSASIKYPSIISNENINVNVDVCNLTSSIQNPNKKVIFYPQKETLLLTNNIPSVSIESGSVLVDKCTLSIVLNSHSVNISESAENNMIYPIVKKLYDEMTSAVGPNSSYETDKIENIYINLPDTITGNSFLSIEYGDKSSGEYEIGQNFSFHYTYNIDIIIGVKHSDKIEALELLDKLEKRVLIALTNSTVESVYQSESTVTERVLTMKLAGANYTDLYEKTDLAYGIRLNLQVETQLDING